MRSRQQPHLRRSKKGKKFVAGRGHKKIKRKQPVEDCSPSMQREVIKSYQADIQTLLKQTGRVNIPTVGILRVKTKPARRARMGMNPFTKEKMMFPAKPRSKVVKFRAGKALKERLN